MSLSTNLLRVLLEKGVDLSTILEVSQAAEAERLAADEARREKRRDSNRKRQKAWYDRHVRDNRDNVVSACDNASHPVMQREDGEATAEQRPPTPPKILPEDITPSLPSEASAPLPAKPRRFVWPADFREIFWAAYPRKTDRKKGLMALDRIYRADRTSFDDVMAGVERLVASDTDEQFLPHASTWVRNERWTDLIPSRTPAKSPRAPPGRATADSWFAAARENDDLLMEETDVSVPFPDDAGSLFGSGGYANGHARPAPQQPFGGDRRLPPPRPAGPPRPH